MDNIIFVCKYCGVIALLVVAVIQDLRSRRIKNNLCLIGVALGLVLVVLDSGWTIKDWGFGLALSFAIGFVMWILGMFCAGDAKIFCVVGACWGYKAFANCFVFTLLIGGVFSLLYMIVKGELSVRLKNVLRYLKNMAMTMKFYKYAPIKELNNNLPFSVFILSGTLISAITGNGLFL